MPGTGCPRAAGDRKCGGTNEHVSSFQNWWNAVRECSGVPKGNVLRKREYAITKKTAKKEKMSCSPRAVSGLSIDDEEVANLEIANSFADDLPRNGSS